MRNTFLWLGLALLAGCSVHRAVVSSGDRGLARVVNNAQGLKGHDFGLALYDPSTGEWLYQRQADQYFTPASNTKILTLYTALQCLGDSTIALYYVTRGDSLYFWGAADPSLLYTPIPDADRALDQLRSHEGPLFYAPHVETDKFGPGWSWGDYQYAYQVERSELPLYGNRIRFRVNGPDSPLEVEPDYFSQYVTMNPDAPYSIQRLPFANAFEINPDRVRRFPWEVAVPFAIDDYLLMELLRDTLGRRVDLAYGFDHPSRPRTITGVPVDTLYRRLMQQSDNFIAEQLLLQSALTVLDTFAT
ncbi:MAG: D-alanyl-D-alanine carboxypeptidase, partial [Saprospiraceae bacterium]|nr:D-alanyl-D-alanine carboxypeptidase [Saprospiraceae bacterium]